MLGKHFLHNKLFSKVELLIFICQNSVFLNIADYEYVFAKRTHPSDSITVRDLDGFFKECDHYPSKREIFNAISGATKSKSSLYASKTSFLSNERKMFPHPLSFVSSHLFVTHLSCWSFNHPPSPCAC